MSIRELLAGHIEKASVDQLRVLLLAIRRGADVDKPPPDDALDVIRELANAHIDNIEFHARRLSELASLLAGTLRDPKRSFHGGQLNVAMMIAARLTHTTARVCVEAILDEDDKPSPETN